MSIVFDIAGSLLVALGTLALGIRVFNFIWMMPFYGYRLTGRLVIRRELATVLIVVGAALLTRG